MPSQPFDRQSLTTEAIEFIDRTCKEFEAAVRCGGDADPANLVEEAPAHLQTCLLQKLTAVQKQLGREPAGAAESLSAFDTVIPQGTDSHPGDETLPDADRPVIRDGALPGRIGRYEVQEKLGCGGFGVVYRAWDPQLERDVALKVPLPGSLNTHERKQRFLGEGKAAARLRHASIVPVFDAGEDEGAYYIASAFIAGRTLQSQLQSGRPDFHHTVDIVSRLASALAYAHGAGIVHRDIKPANIMIDDQGDPMLMDFGLAAREDNEEKLTRDGQGMGTPAYMAPEQALGKANQASDQYSLGCVLYEMLTGRTPFTGSPNTQIVLHQTQQPDPPRGIDPSIPEILQAACLRCLQKDPGSRYPTVAAFAAALEVNFQNTATVGAPATTVEFKQPSQPSNDKITRFWKPALAVLAVIAFAVVALLVWRPWDSRIPVPPVSMAGPTPPAKPSVGAPAPEWDWDIKVWNGEDESRNGISVRNLFEALPAQQNDGWQLEFKLERPQYLYLVWIDAEGVVTPVYPWKGFDWNRLPANQQPVTQLKLPEDSDSQDGKREIFDLDTGDTDCLLLLARDKPAPDAFDWQKAFKEMSPLEFSGEQRITEFNRQSIRTGLDRAPSIKKVDDDLETLRSRLTRNFSRDEFPLLEGLVIRKK